MGMGMDTVLLIMMLMLMLILMLVMMDKKEKMIKQDLDLPFQLIKPMIVVDVSIAVQ